MVLNNALMVVMDPRGIPDRIRLVVCDDSARLVAERAGFEAVSWTDLLLRDRRHEPTRLDLSPN